MNTWFRVRPRPGASVRVFAFPHGGGGASLFARWSREAAPDLEICPCQLPGHEDRIKEAPVTELKVLLDGVVGGLDGLLDMPFAFFGHSFGAQLAFHLAHALRKRGLPAPAHVFVSGSSAPGVRLPLAVGKLADTDLLARVVQWYGGISPAVLAEPELVGAVLPGVKADFRLFDEMAASPAPPLDVPISAFGGMTDPTVSERELGLWAAHTRRQFRLQMFEGGHFYLRGAERALLQSIAHDLERLARAGGASR